jgi:hypothetical protein
MRRRNYPNDWMADERQFARWRERHLHPNVYPVAACRGKGGFAPKSSLLTGLAAYYAFETLTADSTGNGNTLTNHNTVTQAAGLIGQAASFNGTNQYLSNVGPWFNSPAWSIAFWVNPTSVTGDIYPVSMDDTGSNRIGWIKISGGNLVLTVLYNSGGSSAIAQDITNKISAGSWFLCICWSDGANAYIQVNNNAAVQGGAIGSGVETPASVPLQIGGWSAAGGWYPGLIDEAGVWNRVLTPKERSSLYKSGAGRTYPFAGG